MENVQGNGTSMISLIIPPKDQLSRVSKLLLEEYGTASNIKSRVNRLAVLSAITTTQQRLKLYSSIPMNGLIIYCGTLITEEDKEKLIIIDFEPFKPINTSLYLCDNKFHIEPLNELIISDTIYGYIIVDGEGVLYGTLSGNKRTILHKFSVMLPKKHNKGGQSSARFGRIRIEKRHNYIRKVAETAAQLFITNDHVTINGLIIAGCADLKSELSESKLFDPRLESKILQLFDISYGNEMGFNQAIEMSQSLLEGVTFLNEKKLLQSYFDLIAQDTGRYCYGLEQTLEALESGAVEIMIVWENYESSIYTPDWFADNYTQFGAKLSIISDKTPEGSQFVKGFGGIGGILRYKMDFIQEEESYDED